MQSEESLVDLLNTEHLTVGLKWLELMSVEGRWDLRHDQRLTLLGNISEVEYSSLLALNENGKLNKLSIPVLEKLVLLIKISASLAALVGSDHSYAAFKNKNSHPIFNSQSIKNFLLSSQSVESYYVALRYLENAMYQ